MFYIENERERRRHEHAQELIVVPLCVQPFTRALLRAPRRASRPIGSELLCACATVWAG